MWVSVCLNGQSTDLLLKALISKICIAIGTEIVWKRNTVTRNGNFLVLMKGMYLETLIQLWVWISNTSAVHLYSDLEMCSLSLAIKRLSANVLCFQIWYIFSVPICMIFTSSFLLLSSKHHVISYTVTQVKHLAVSPKQSEHLKDVNRRYIIVL